MLFNTPSANLKAIQENLIVPTMFVMAQAARKKESISFAQLAEAVVRTQSPADDGEATMIKRALYDLMGRHELVKRGLVSHAKVRAEDAPPIVNISQRGMALLGRRCVDLVDMPNLKQEISIDPNAPRNLEQGLLLPMLVTLVKMHEEYGLPVKMGEWREGTKRMLNLSPEDLGPLVNRSDTKIDQVMRNIKSHNTMQKTGWAEATQEGYIPTEKGMARVAELFLGALPSPDFSKMVQIEDAQETLATNVVRPRMRRS